MFEASHDVYFQYVNEPGAQTVFPVGRSGSLISLVVGWLSTTGVL